MTDPFISAVLAGHTAVRDDMFRANPRTALGRQLRKRITIGELLEMEA